MYAGLAESCWKCNMGDSHPNTLDDFSRRTYAKGTPLLCKKAPIACQCFGSDLFTPVRRVLFTFPSQYLCTIDLQSIMWLRRWFSCVQTVNVLLVHTSCGIIQDFHLLWCSIPKAFTVMDVWCHCRFLSPILTASRLIFVPVVTKMFQFTTCNHWCGFPRWGLCTFQNVFSDTMFRIVKRPYVHWSQGIHKTPRLSFVAKDGLEPSTAGLWILCSNQLSYLAIVRSISSKVHNLRSASLASLRTAGASPFFEGTQPSECEAFLASHGRKPLLRRCTTFGVLRLSRSAPQEWGRAPSKKGLILQRFRKPIHILLPTFKICMYWFVLFALGPSKCLSSPRRKIFDRL